MLWPLFTPGKGPSAHCTGGWVGPRAGLKQVRIISPPDGIQSPDRPAHSQSLYRLRYPAHGLCFSRLSDSRDWGLCNRVNHRGVIYASWNAENLRPSAMLTSCACTIDFM